MVNNEFFKSVSSNIGIVYSVHSIRVRALSRWGRVEGLRQGEEGLIMTYAVEKRGGGGR